MPADRFDDSAFVIHGIVASAEIAGHIEAFVSLVTLVPYHIATLTFVRRLIVDS